MSSSITIRRIPRDKTDAQILSYLDGFFHARHNQNAQGFFDYEIFDIGRTLSFFPDYKDNYGVGARSIHISFPSSQTHYQLCEAIAKLIVRELGGTAYNDYTDKKIEAMA